MILINKNTTQTPLVAQGRTGEQSIKFIPAPRVYIGPPDYGSPPNTIFSSTSDGIPSTFADLGIVEGKAEVKIKRDTTQVFSNLGKFGRMVASQGISGEIDFTLSQLDDIVLEKVSGTYPNSGLTGQYANYLLGGPNLRPAALLLAIQNKLDGKEWQFYNPLAMLSFSFDMSESGATMKVTGILPAFTSMTGNQKQILSITIFSQSEIISVDGYGFGAWGDSPYGG